MKVDIKGEGGGGQNWQRFKIKQNVFLRIQMKKRKQKMVSNCDPNERNRYKFEIILEKINANLQILNMKSATKMVASMLICCKIKLIFVNKIIRCEN